MTENRTDKRVPQVHCPTCNQLVPWSDASPWRPFCSRRCRLIDLGSWLDESNRIEGEPLIDPSLDPEALDPDLFDPDRQ